MSFTTPIFAVFLVGVFAAFQGIRLQQFRTILLIAASYSFYGWWNPWFVGLLFATSLVDFAIARRIAASIGNARKLWLAVSLGSNLGILIFFKYASFLADSLSVVASLVGVSLPTLGKPIPLPPGISFYTFQSLSYTLDIYRGTLTVGSTLGSYLAYISFFPQLVAGPIERARDLLPQFQSFPLFDAGRAASGCRLMLWGLVKKLALADNLALLAEPAFASPGTASIAQLLSGILAFSLQIYLDFSAYSDIAAGCARLFGIELTRNFHLPYFAGSLTEFWRRWHITLSSWFRDYIYLPLGGNRHPTRSAFAVLMLTFLVSGLWHGASWTFILWGGLHGIALQTDRSWFSRHTGMGHSFARRIFTLGILWIGWVLFRSSSLNDAWTIYSRCFQETLDPGLPAALIAEFSGAWKLWVALSLFLGIEWRFQDHWNPLDALPSNTWIRWPIYTAILWISLLAMPGDIRPFIYFQF